MKNRMKPQKNSKFLRDLRRANMSICHSKIRLMIRRTNQYPSSVKVGAGDICARRSLPTKVQHRRNHRVNDVIQGYLYKNN